LVSGEIRALPPCHRDAWSPYLRSDWLFSFPAVFPMEEVGGQEKQ